jgi:hypothetical protein
VPERVNSVVRSGQRLPRWLLDGAREVSPGVPPGTLLAAGLWLLGPDAGLDRALIHRALVQAVSRPQADTP